MATILLIEDNDFLVDIYSRVLTSSNYQLVVRKNGEEGLNLAQSGHFDLILLDILLPGISGMEVLKQLKSNPKTASIPVYMLTNLGQESIIDQAYKFGADGYLVKSQFLPNQISKEVDNALTKGLRNK